MIYRKPKLPLWLNVSAIKTWVIRSPTQQTADEYLHARRPYKMRARYTKPDAPNPNPTNESSVWQQD